MELQTVATEPVLRMNVHKLTARIDPGQKGCAFSCEVFASVASLCFTHTIYGIVPAIQEEKTQDGVEGPESPSPSKSEENDLARLTVLDSTFLLSQ